METKITEDEVYEIEDHMGGYGFECSTVHGYSGRGMYAKECIGFVGPKAALLALGAALAKALEDDDRVDRMMHAARTDNMGRDKMIVYFPEFTQADDGNQK